MHAEAFGKYKFILQAFAVVGLLRPLHSLGRGFLTSLESISWLCQQSSPYGQESVTISSFSDCERRLSGVTHGQA